MILKIFYLVLFSFIIYTTQGQIDTEVEFANAAREFLDAPKVVKSIDDVELEKTSHVKYLSRGFKKAYVSSSKEIYYLRYNIFSDEMEFTRNEKTYALNKRENSIIDFFEIKKKYAVFKLEGELNYFQIVATGKNTLLKKQTIDFEKGKKAITQFDVAIKPKYSKNKANLYIAFNNTALVKVPKKKKKFYKLFGSKKDLIKKFIKNKRLAIKKETDLKTILTYYNSL
jgi:hypothetical protein